MFYILLCIFDVLFPSNTVKCLIFCSLLESRVQNLHISRRGIIITYFMSYRAVCDRPQMAKRMRLSSSLLRSRDDAENIELRCYRSSECKIGCNLQTHSIKLIGGGGADRATDHFYSRDELCI